MKEKICLNTPADSNTRRNELRGGFPEMELETDTPIMKSTWNILCIRKGSIKHHEPLLYFLAMIQHVVAAHYSFTEREKN